MVLCFSNSGGRVLPSPTDSARTAVEALFFAIPGCRASPSPSQTGFATVVPVAVELHFTSSRGRSQFAQRSTVEHVPAGPASLHGLSLFRVEVRPQPARQSPVALVHAGPATPRRQSLPGIEVHPQFARPSAVALVHAGPVTASSVSRSCRPSPSGHPEAPSTPSETTLVGAVPGMAAATQWPPATLTELTWLHQCRF